MTGITICSQALPYYRCTSNTHPLLCTTESIIRVAYICPIYKNLHITETTDNMHKLLINATRIFSAILRMDLPFLLLTYLFINEVLEAKAKVNSKSLPWSKLKFPGLQWICSYWFLMFCGFCISYCTPYFIRSLIRRRSVFMLQISINVMCYCGQFLQKIHIIVR
jgi:hypothetical protein